MHAHARRYFDGEGLSSESALSKINAQLNWRSVRPSIYQTEDHTVISLQSECNIDGTALRESATSTERHFLTRDCHISAYTVDIFFFFFI